MSAWRRKALEELPELRRELSDRHEVFSIYALWFELLPRVRGAHRASDEDLLRRIYGFADWCRRHSGELSNAVAVAFYEHLFDERWMRPLVTPWLSDEIVRDHWDLWASRLSPDELSEVEDLVRAGRGDRERKQLG